jgi:hypothetical protein
VPFESVEKAPVAINEARRFIIGSGAAKGK